MANTYKNIVITPNIGSSSADPTIQFSGANNSANTDIYLRVYPTSNGTLSFEGSSGQLFSIKNDLTKTIFAASDISGIPLLEVNVASQIISIGETYGNVAIGANSSSEKLKVVGNANVTANLLVGIGVTTPNVKLQVVGNMAVSNFYENDINVASNVTITTGRNAMSAGPITINNGVVVTVPSGSTWTIV